MKTISIEIPEGHKLVDKGDGVYKVEAVSSVDWKPEFLEEYEFIDDDGDVVANCWTNGTGNGGKMGLYEKSRAAIHNIFPKGTGEQAAKTIKYCMAQAQAKAIIESEFEPDSENLNQKKYYTFYHCQRKRHVVARLFFSTVVEGIVFFLI